MSVLRAVSRGTSRVYPHERALLPAHSSRLNSELMMPCPACGTDNPQDARFCVRCGAALFASCAGCGTELPPAAAFCPSCGTPVAKAEAPSAGDEHKLVTVLFADIAGS